jgi:hypothetical protein
VKARKMTSWNSQEGLEASALKMLSDILRLGCNSELGVEIEAAVQFSEKNATSNLHQYDHSFTD